MSEKYFQQLQGLLRDGFQNRDVDSLSTREQSKLFRQLGHTLFVDPNGHFDIRAGDIYEAETARGQKNLIVAFRIVEGWMLYGHGDKVKKTPLGDFIRAIESGDLELKYVDEIDVERLEMCQIMLDGIANRRTFEETLQLQEAEAFQWIQRNGGVLNGVSR